MGYRSVNQGVALTTSSVEKSRGILLIDCLPFIVHEAQPASKRTPPLILPPQPLSSTPSSGPPNADNKITHQNSSNSTTYARPLGHELVCSKHPSCSKLPPSWNQIHDRFIAYLSTHAPLDRNGDIPRNEERRECWKSEDIARLVMERFPEIGRYYVSTLTLPVYRLCSEIGVGKWNGQRRT